MIYHSTRNKENKYTSKEAILKGLCEDGGLFVSDDLLNCSIDMKSLMELDYNGIAFEVFKKLLTDYSDEELKDCINKAYTGKFETKDIAPLTPIGKNFLLELYHGPTCAFKDFALCMLPQLMSKANKTGKKIMILTATSGDTGKAALSGFKDADNIGITVFFPHEKVSRTQCLQMVTSEGKNVFVSAVRGNFDDCQTGVKRIFTNKSKDFENEYKVMLSSANSINVGRLVPQIVYYIDAYRKLVKNNNIVFGEKVDYCVPTGNFGDILAGYYAKLLGLPVGKLIVASNENKVLYDFLSTGIYDRNREFVKTNSPSMDILVSSNLERMLYYLSGCDEKLVSSLMSDLSKTGRFEISKELLSKIRETFDCGFCTDSDCMKTIDAAWNEDRRLIDPHTAVALKVSKDIQKKSEKTSPLVILSTASPFKFTEDMEKMSEISGEKIPAPLYQIEKKKVLHESVVDIEKMADFVENCILKMPE